MARDVKVGILISAKDQSSKAFKAAANSADTLFKGVRVGTTAASAGMKTFAIAATGMNQALELAKKGAQVFRETIGLALQKSIEYRSENDAQVRQLQEFQKSISILAARIGDVLLPVVQGIATAFGPAVQAATEWLELNFKWLASGILENFFSFAQVLVSGVAVGASTAAKAFFGLRMIVDGVALILEKFFEMALRGFAAFSNDAAKLAGLLRMRGLAGALQDVSNGAANMATEFKRSAAQSAQAVGQHVNSLEATENTIERVRDALERGIGVAGVKAMQAMKLATVSGNRSLEERAALLEAEKQKQAELAAFTIEQEKILEQNRNAREAAEKQAEQERIRMAMERAKAIAEIEERNRRQYMATAEVAINQAAGIGNAYGKVFHAIIAGQASVGAGYVAMMAIAGQAVLDFAQKAIMTYALEAAAASYKSQAGIPFIGPVLGAAAAATALGVVRAYLGQLPAYATGGEVRGGVPGRDSVLAMLTPGERVLTVQENREMKRGSGGASQQVNQTTVNIGMSIPSSRADLDRYIRDTVLQSTKRLSRYRG